MLIKEVIQRIQSLYSHGVESDDSRLESRHIYNKMLTLRAMLISQKAKKKQHISDWNYQTIPCVSLIKAPVHECPCLPPVGCETLKSEFPLPKPLLNYDGHLLQAVTSVEGSLSYDLTTWKEKKYKKGNRYTSTKPDYYIRNNFLYVTHKQGARVISITGLFEDPIEADKYRSYCEECLIEEQCYDCEAIEDKEFPFSVEQIDTLIEMAAKELIQVFNTSLEDITNDTKDNLTQQTK